MITLNNIAKLACIDVNALQLPPREQNQDNPCEGDTVPLASPLNARIQAEMKRFEEEREKLRKDFHEKSFDLAAEKAVKGGKKELQARRDNLKKSFDELEAATNSKWPIEIDSKVRKLNRAFQDLAEISAATGGKPVTDKELLSNFRKLILEAGIAEENVRFSETGLSMEGARWHLIFAKANLYKLHEWNGFEFEVLAISGRLGKVGEEPDFKAVPILYDVERQLKEHPNLKEKRDKVIKDLVAKHGSHENAQIAVAERVTTYQNVQAVFHAYAKFKISEDLLRRANRQVEAALNQNGDEWASSASSYPEFKSLVTETQRKRQQAIDATMARITELQKQIREEETKRRLK